MVGNSKILTVSYGTFSCTLEGFDDSFDTMKAIAEYFRDLAGDDRYFGAEPPQPDAELLAKIAEKELARGVRGQADGNTVVLRPAALLQEEDAVQATPPSPAPEPLLTDTQDAPGPEDVADETPQDEAEAKASEAEPAASEEDARAEVRARRRARRLAAQEAAAEKERADTARQEEERATAKAAKAAAAQAAKAAAAQAEAEARAQAEASEAEAAEAEAQARAAAMAEAQLIEEAAQRKAEEDAIAEAEAAEAARQAEARENAERLKAEAREEAARISEAAQAAAERRLALQNAQAEEAEVEDTAAEAAPAPAPVMEAPDASEEADDSIAAKLRRIRAVVGTPSPQSVAQEYSEDEHAEEVDESAVDDIADMAGDARSAVAALNIMADDANVDDEDNAPMAEPTPAPTQDRPRARVIKMKKADFEQVIASGQLEEITEGDAPAQDPAQEDDAASTLSAEDEEELMRELVAAQQEETPLDDAQPVMDAELDAQPQAQEAPAPTEPPAPTEAAAESQEEPARETNVVERILEKTNEEMEEPESKTRRNAIAQLKAAVAATEAARQMGESTDTRADAESAFRQDLEDVVRPRRPKPSDARTRRPVAPLKLVPSQRVDENAQEAPAPEQPVRPRRVAALKAENAPEADGSFADFAQSQGANSLADLLEAAAVYTAEVEGNTTFSRPQIMRRALKASEGQHSREDGLRFFGTLLREGRIEKIGGGQFQITQATRFRSAG